MERKQTLPLVDVAKYPRAGFTELKSQRAEEMGRFYNAWLDMYLEARSEHVPSAEGRVVERLKLLPDSARVFFEKAIRRFNEELEENRRLIEIHRGQEVEYLFGALITSMQKEVGELGAALKAQGRAVFLEPSPGVCIIQVDIDIFNLLKSHGLVHAEGGAVCFASDRRDEPSFLVVRRMSKEEGLTGDSERIKKHPAVRHEFHHFIWNFLKREKGLLRQVVEDSPEREKAFEVFRDEMMAYIIEERPLTSVDAEVLTYSEEEDILVLAEDVRDFVAVGMEFSRQKGIDPQAFLLAVISAKSFADIKDRSAMITPLETIDEDSIEGLYNVWEKNKRTAIQIRELLDRKEVAVPAKRIEEYGERRMSAPSNATVKEILMDLDRLKKFAQVVGVGAIDEQKIIDKVVRPRLRVPEETKEIILRLPPAHLVNVPLGVSGKEFILGLISFWNINQEADRQIYGQIINSSSAMREVFDAVQEELTEQGAASYRQECISAGENRDKVESEIISRTRYIRAL